jgi:hypothetical protein
MTTTLRVLALSLATLVAITGHGAEPRVAPVTATRTR